MKECILLTGGAGFIGSHIAENLVEAGYEVVVVDNLSSGNFCNLRNIVEHTNFHFVNADIRDIEQLENVFREYKPQIVNHHAAQKSVPYSVDNPLVDESINVNGLLNLVVLAGKYQINSFVYVSSGGALSKNIEEGECSTESDIPQLMSPYAINKYSGEKYIELYSKIYDFNYTILRYANVYGPRQIIDGESGVIPIFLNNILSGKESLLMTYEDMPRGCIRDYVYVSDVVEANRIAVEHPLNEVVNIASGQGVPILDVYYLIQKIFRKDVGIKVVGPRKGDIRRSVEKVDKLCGWKPDVNLEKGLELLKEYYCSQSNEL